MCPHGYYTLMRESKDPVHLRLRMVQEAKRRGIKPTAVLFSTSPTTVRKWHRRFDGTLGSLADHSRAPHWRPGRIAAEAEEEIVRAKRKLLMAGARRLKLWMKLPYSVKVICRVLKERGLLRRWRRKKHEVKRCLRAIKREWALWQQITVDTKYLSDLPEYWIQVQELGLPRYQYSAREVSTGVLFLGYADELSLTYAELFVQRIAAHLEAHGVDLSKVTWQTDNGGEFVGSWQATEESAFTKTLAGYGSRHRTIPPGQHRFQADVETVHGMMEVEFYLERFKSRRDFLSKATTYQHFFNYVRPNMGKENKSPWQLIQEKDSTAPPQLLYLAPVFLEALLEQRLHRTCGVHDVWEHPSF